MRWHALSLTAAALGVTLTLAGCGGSADPLASVLRAARNTLSQGAEMDLTLRGATLFGPRSGPIFGRELVAFPSGEGYEAVQLPQEGQRPTGAAHLIFLPSEVYVAPLLRSALPNGRFWFSTTLTRSGPLARRLPTLAESLEGLNPQLLLDEIIWGAVGASSSGQRVLAHVPVAEYSASVDLQRALSGASGPAAAAMRSAISEELAALGATGAGRAPASLRMSVWVDGARHIVELQATVPGSGLGVVLMGLRNFGVTFPSSLPGASQVVDLASLPRTAGIVSVASVFSGTR